MNRRPREGGTAKGLPGRPSEGDPSLDGCAARETGKSRDRTPIQIYIITGTAVHTGTAQD